MTLVLEYSLFSESAMQALLIGFFKEKQYRALGALKNVIKLINIVVGIEILRSISYCILHYFDVECDRKF